MKKALKIVVNIFAWLVLILALLITIIVFSSDKNNGVANLFGYIPLTVESDSMVPTFKKGDLIICKDVDDINTLKEGDVITFWTIIDGRRVKNTHRIVGINQAETTRSFVTRGDNNSIDDTLPAYGSDIIGKWTETKLTGVGKAMNFLRTKKGFFICKFCIIIPMALFFLFELYKFIIALIEAKRPETPEIDEEEIKRRAIEEYLASKGEKAEDTAEKLAEKAEGAKETVKEKAEEAAEKLAEKAEDAKETVREKAEEAAEKAEEIKETADEAAEAAADKAEE